MLIRYFTRPSRIKELRTNPAVATATTPHHESIDGDLAYWAGGMYALLGENAQALTWFRRAVELGNQNYPWFEHDKNYDRLRGNPEYQRVMADVRRHWEHYRDLFGSG